MIGLENCRSRRLLKPIMEIKGIKLSTLFLAVCIYVIGYAKAATKIIGGQFAAWGEFPYQVSIRQHNIHWCGGGIIDATHILTAAHCVISNTKEISRPENLLVVAGTIDTEDLRNDTVFPVSAVIPHGQYSAHSYEWGATHFADIAILKLARIIPFNNFRKFAPIDPPNSYASAGTLAVVSGWGVSYYVGGEGRNVRWLQKLYLRTISLAQCQEFLPNQVNVGQICAIGRPKISSTCFGDSGGPLVHNNQVIGLVSWARWCADVRPTVFTSVYDYLRWIKWAITV